LRPPYGIPQSRMKMRRGHAVTLPIQAVEMLRALIAVTGRHALLFLNRDDLAKAMATAFFDKPCWLGLAGLGGAVQASLALTRPVLRVARF
jgi:integrase